jgi:hypothetical protein
MHHTDDRKSATALRTRIQAMAINAATPAARQLYERWLREMDALLADPTEDAGLADRSTDDDSSEKAK